MTVRLRAHHLLCALTYVGAGYSPAFVANFDAVIARLRAGESVLAVDGPDDVCAPLAGMPEGEHCRSAATAERDTRARATLGVATALDAGIVAERRAGFAAGTIRAACAGCRWAPLCDGIAARGFTGVRL